MGGGSYILLRLLICGARGRGRPGRRDVEHEELIVTQHEGRGNAIEPAFERFILQPCPPVIGCDTHRICLAVSSSVFGLSLR